MSAGIVWIGGNILLNKVCCASRMISSYQEISKLPERCGAMRIELKRCFKLFLGFRPFLFRGIDFRQVEMNSRIVWSQLLGNKDLRLCIVQVLLFRQHLREELTIGRVCGKFL